MARPKKAGRRIAKVDAAEDGTLRLPVFLSMKAVEAACGIPVRVMKKGRAAGCAAFGVNGRVDLGMFLRWHFSPERIQADDTGADDADDPSKLDWDTRKKRADALYQEEKLLERQLRSVPIDVLDRLHQRVGTKARLMLEAKLVSEAPARVADRGVAEVRGVLDRIAGEVCAAMCDGLSAKALAAEIKAGMASEDDAEDDETEGVRDGS